MEGIKKKKYIIFLAIAVVCFGIDFILFELSDSWSVFDVFLRFALWFLGIVTFLIGTAKHIHSKKDFALSILLLPFIIATFTISVYLIKYINDEKEALFQAYYDGDINGLALDLYKDGTYRMVEYSTFSGQSYKGDYRLMNGTIELKKANSVGEDRFFFTNKYQIEGNQLKLLSEEKEFIFQITKNELFNHYQ